MTEATMRRWRSAALIAGAAVQVPVFGLIALASGADGSILAVWFLVGLVLATVLMLRGDVRLNAWWLLLPIGFYGFQMLFRVVRPQSPVLAPSLSAGFAAGMTLAGMVALARARTDTIAK